MQAINRTRQQILIERGLVARTAEARLCGLIGRAALADGEGLFLVGTKSIHTFGMRFAIDVVFLDPHGHVIHLIHAMKPSQFSAFVWRATGVLEMPAGVLHETGTRIGDCIEIVERDATHERVRAAVESG